MKNLISKKLIITLLAIVMLITVATKVSATGSGLQLDLNTDVEQINIITNEDVVAPTTPTTNTASTNESELPQTGDASDYAIFALIAISVVVSIYAYKKVRDYNNI